MPTKLSVKAMDELSMVYKHKDGQEWGPRNPEARVLAVKGGTAAPKEKPGWFEKAVAAVKALGKKPEEVLKSWYTDPVVGDVADNIDGDGDGASDYNAIVALVTSMGCDLSSACVIQDDDGRSAAVVAIIDNFLEELDKIRAGDSTGKAGKRHSAADQERIDAATDAHAKLGKALDAANKAHATIGDALDGLRPSQSDDGSQAGADDDAAKASIAKDEAPNQLADKSDKKDGKPEGDYGTDEEAGYADKGWQADGKPRYPTKKDGKVNAERVRSAWSYINKESNASKYSSEDLAKVKANIKAAAKECGVEISDDSSKSGEIEMTKEEIAALVAAEVAKAREADKASLQAEIDAAKETASKAQADAEKAKSEAEAAKAAQAAAEAALNGKARETSQKSGGESDGNGVAKRRYPNLSAALKAANASQSSQPMGREITPQVAA